MRAGTEAAVQGQMIRHFVKASRWFALTKACSRFGARAVAMPLSVRRWTCGSCGRDHDRDVSAARSVRQQGILAMKAAGPSVFSACGERGLRNTGPRPPQPDRQEAPPFRAESSHANQIPHHFPADSLSGVLQFVNLQRHPAQGGSVS